MEDVDYLTDKTCVVSSPLKHVDFVGEIVEEAVYNFLVDAGERFCICNKAGVWRLTGCKRRTPSKQRSSLYSKVPMGEVTVYLVNGKITGRLVHVGKFEVVVAADHEYFIHKDLIVALCWRKV